jgi:NhaA family Na+:H+ antiporter
MAEHVPLRGDHRPIDRIMSPIQRFLRIEAAGGILLLGATLVALVWANSPWAEGYHHFWHTKIEFGFGADSPLEMSLAHFVNDGLMAVFFFVVGLEIKRELMVGELSSMRQAAMPLAAAVGGMIVPALIFVAIVLPSGRDGIEGWAIPMATDIAFAVGIMAMLGKRVSLSLKVFLTALAIVDDIGAVVVIATCYTSQILVVPLIIAGVMIATSLLANRLGIRTPLVYAILGLVMWLALLESGVHATIGGVLLALTIPTKMRIRGHYFVEFATQALEKFREAGGDEDDIITNPQRQSAVHGLEQACEAVQTPLNRLEHGLHTWVAFLIMPIFALANAGVTLGAGFGDAVGTGVGLGVALGLLIGKPAGILLATWAAVKTGLADLPAGSSFKQIVGAGFLAGIGFTMSLFIANLAYRGEGEEGTLQLAKTGILCGSLVAGIVGFILLRTGAPPDVDTEPGDES